jgi:hypothetical protein
MSEAATTVAKPQMKPNQTLIVGRINHTGTFPMNGKTMHEARVAQAAPDQYSMPGAVMVQSSYKLGSAGDEVKVLCDVTGFPDRFTDRQGEVKQTARIVLRVVE